MNVQLTYNTHNYVHVHLHQSRAVLYAKYCVLAHPCNPGFLGG
jgi:hypothetical protein